MILSTDWIGLSTFITATAAALVSVLTVVRQTSMRQQVDQVHEQVDQVHDEVRTINSLTLGQMAEAQETRRIDQISHEDRTDLERQHIAEIPMPEQHDGPRTEVDNEDVDNKEV